MTKYIIDDRGRALADELVRAREASGLTKHQLAACVGVGRSHIDALEMGRTQTSLKRFRDIADALNVPLAQILAPYLNDLPE